MVTRRQRPRFDIVLPCRTRHGAVEIESRTLNVSVGGALVRGGPESSILTLELALPSMECVSATGVVRHQGLDGGIGVEFVIMAIDGRERWATWLTRWLEDHRSDRRIAERVRAELVVWATSSDGMKGYPVGDISQGGMFLHTLEPLPVGTPVHAVVVDPGTSESVERNGQVAWARTGGAPEERGIGIAFHGGTPEQDRALASIIES
ncbi:MAG: hypothetical protein GY913_29945 [Proteobacteria bacterium]|nr:hypothetical protein [Pseudomonadota bacterium]MCP4921139.1 hypothetical protein [Pseudomonadota bacterium]